MVMTSVPPFYMWRAITLARMADPLQVAPNPRVGAVLVHGERIIGEGFHHRKGCLHAERNCIASVKDEDRSLLPHSTLYVTLEPCSHYGATPPCVEAILENHIPTVVVGCIDPNPKVAGSGISRLRSAGVEVVVGILEEECYRVAEVFMVNQIKNRPYVTLKWAQSQDGFLDRVRTDRDSPASKFSSAFTSMLVHRLRSRTHGILVGANTVRLDHPSLTTRLWSGKSPRPIAIGDASLSEEIASYDDLDRWLILSDRIPLDESLHSLYLQGIYSLMVEGGAQTLQRFLDTGLWNSVRVEVAPLRIGEGVPAPELPDTSPEKVEEYDGRTIFTLHNSLL